MLRENSKVIYPELSYSIVGILFKIHREPGNRYSEKIYQRAIAKALTRESFQYRREVYMPIIYDDEIVGKQYFDFVVEDKIVLEIKTVPRFRLTDFRQILAYLKHANLRLGILVNFRTESLRFRRIVNSR